MGRDPSTSLSHSLRAWLGYAQDDKLKIGVSIAAVGEPLRHQGTLCEHCDLPLLRKERARMGHPQLGDSGVCQPGTRTGFSASCEAVPFQNRIKLSHYRRLRAFLR